MEYEMKDRSIIERSNPMKYALAATTCLGNRLFLSYTKPLTMNNTSLYRVR